jgi:hypothetical protein
VTTYYVSASGSNTSPYDTWAKAATALSTVTGLAVAGDIVWVSSSYTENNGTATTYTPTGVALLSTSDTTNMPPTSVAAGASIGTVGGNSLILNGGYWYGFSFLAGTSSSSTSLNVAAVDNASVAMESCTLKVNSTGAGGALNIGIANTSNCNSFFESRNCTFLFSATAHHIVARGYWLDEGSVYASSGTVPTKLFTGMNFPANVKMVGSDLSAITGTLFDASAGWFEAQLANCKLGSGVTVLATQSVDGSGEVYLFDCNAGDVHYFLGHYNYRGETEATASKYANDGAQYDGTNYHSLTVTGVNATLYQPYMAPWIDAYTAGGSSVTPYFEIARDGSATAFKNDEVWAEFMAKTTSGYPVTTLYSDRRALTASAANQASGAASWTGLGGTNWKGKVDSGAALTPAEIGFVRGRLCLGANVTVQLDPQIRGL